MTKIKSKALLFFVSLLSALSIFSNYATTYAANSGVQGVTISPAFQMVNIAAGQQQEPVYFTVTNDKSSSQSFNLSIADFNTLEDTGGLFFVGANPTQLEQKYGLAKWASLPQGNITAAPHQTVTIIVNILNLPTLSPGGHYGALMLSINNGSTQTQSPSTNNVGLHPIASSLMFVTKVGGDTHYLRLVSVSDNHNLFKLPTTVSLKFKNDGNTHLIPRGTVTILNSKNKIISQGIINENSDIILPQLDRIYTVQISKVSNAGLTGKYKVVVSFRFDGLNQFRSFQRSFWVVSGITIFIGAFLIIIIFTAGYLVYKRRTIFKLIRKHKAS